MFFIAYLLLFLIGTNVKITLFGDMLLGYQQRYLERYRRQLSDSHTPTGLMALDLEASGLL